MTQADEVREIRLRLGLSQERFAQRLGVSLQSVRRWEAGLSRPLPLASSMIQALASSVPLRASRGTDTVGTDLGQMLRGLGRFFDVAARLAAEGRTQASARVEDAEYTYGIHIRLGAGGRPVIEEVGNLAATEAADAVGYIAEPVVDVHDGGAELVIIAELPGAEEDQIKITIAGDALEIVADGPRRKYRKRLHLPCRVDAGSGPACSYLNGILEIRCPKADPGSDPS